MNYLFNFIGQQSELKNGKLWVSVFFLAFPDDGTAINSINAVQMMLNEAR